MRLVPFTKVTGSLAVVRVQSMSSMRDMTESTKACIIVGAVNSRTLEQEFEDILLENGKTNSSN